MERKEPNAIFADCINLQKYVRFIINCPGCPPGWFICLLFCLICGICLFSCLRLPIGHVSHGSRLERHCCTWERGLWLSSGLRAAPSSQESVGLDQSSFKHPAISRTITHEKAHPTKANSGPVKSLRQKSRGMHHSVHCSTVFNI